MAENNGFLEVEGNIYPFAVNCLTKDKVLYLPPGRRAIESQLIADGWASMQLMTSELAEDGFDWESTPVYQVNLLLKNKNDLSKDFSEHLAFDVLGEISRIQTALLGELESMHGELSLFGCQGKHVVSPWCETNIVTRGVNKGQSLTRFIHSASVKAKIGAINVGFDVMVAGDAANDLPMFVEWAQVDDFNGEVLKKTERPAIRVIMPDSEDEKLSKESNLRNKVHEVLAAFPETQNSSLYYIATTKRMRTARST